MNRKLLLLSLIPLVFLSCETESGKTNETQSELAIAVSDSMGTEKTEQNVFGIDQTLEKHTHIIHRNESLAQILRNSGLSPGQIHEFNKIPPETFNVRRIRPGRPLHIFSQTDSAGDFKHVMHVVYEENQTRFVRIDLSDSLSVIRDSKPVEKRTRMISGEINNSLYRTMQQLGVDLQLTHRLAEVFAWQIDFYRIMPGDHFKVIYEEILVENQVTDIGRIKFAVFNHRNQDFYAFHYRLNDIDEYFDENGNSLRRDFLAAPLDYTRISSRFRNRRFHPVLQRNMPHHGTDYAAPTGTPVRSVGDGEITVAGYGRNNGNYIRIRHNSVYETGYLHLSRFANGIRSGVKVEQGQIIGYVGQTGLATGPHLCYRFWQNGQPVDPRQVELPAADPLPNQHRTTYLARQEELLYLADMDPDTILNRPYIFSLDIGYSGVLTFVNRDRIDGAQMIYRNFQVPTQDL